MPRACSLFELGAGLLYGIIVRAVPDIERLLGVGVLAPTRLWYAFGLTCGPVPLRHPRFKFGLYISSARPGSLARRAGLAAGDILLGDLGASDTLPYLSELD